MYVYVYMCLFVFKGGYKEFETLADSPMPHLPKANPSPNVGYFVTIFPAAADDANWKEWSGATYIKDNIPDILKLRHITLHKRFTTWPPFNHFWYILLVECSEAMSNQAVAEEFLGKIKTQNENEFSGLFKPRIHYSK